MAIQLDEGPLAANVRDDDSACTLAHKTQNGHLRLRNRLQPFKTFRLVVQVDQAVGGPVLFNIPGPRQDLPLRVLGR